MVLVVGCVCLGVHGVMKLFLFVLFTCFPAMFGVASLFHSFDHMVACVNNDMTLIGWRVEEDGRCSKFWFLLLTLLFDRVMNQFEAARKGDLQQLRVALTGGNVNDVDSNDWTVLHWAARYGRAECANYCIEMGANVNTHSIYGFTPLRIASLSGHVNVVRVLLDADALVDATDDDGWTPLKFAIYIKRVDVARLLMDRGARASNVKLGSSVQSIPYWINALMEWRSNCRFVSIVLIGIHKYRRTTMTGNNDINVLRLISKHIWSTRMDDVWATPIVVETKKLRRNPKRGGKNK
jgi:hypothetical protein